MIYAPKVATGLSPFGAQPFGRLSCCPSGTKTICPSRRLALSQSRFQEQSVRALRCSIARTLSVGSFRDFAARLADSPLLQWFCQVAQLDLVKVPAKSTVQRYATWLPQEEMREVINVLLCKAVAAMAAGKQALDLDLPLDLSTMFLYSTCVKANIHFPVYLVLLLDLVKSLMQSVELIRTH